MFQDAGLWSLFFENILPAQVSTTHFITPCPCTGIAKHPTFFMEVKIINRSPWPLPQYETEGSAGMDLRADLPSPIELAPLERSLVPTGLFIELPVGHEAQIRPRSGLSIKKGLTLVNAPGTIDSDYRGEIKIILVNLSKEPQTVEPGERIAQMVIARHERITWRQVPVLADTERGAGGFGSTGK